MGSLKTKTRYSDLEWQYQFLAAGAGLRVAQFRPPVRPIGPHTIGHQPTSQTSTNQTSVIPYTNMTRKLTALLAPYRSIPHPTRKFPSIQPNPLL